MAQATVDATRLIESLRRRAEHPRTPAAEAALARRKLHDPSNWAVQGPVGVVVVGADVTVERRDGEQSTQTITGLGPITRWGQIGYVR